MMNKIVSTFFTLALLLLTAINAYAHHSFSMFDKDIEMVRQGTVERWAFNNPHVWLYISVIDDDGEKIEWGFEGGAPPSLVRNGITGRTFQPGDEVTVMFTPLKGDRAGGAICWIQVADGSYVKPADGGCGARDPENISRWESWLEQGITSSTEAMAAGL